MRRLIADRMLDLCEHNAQQIAEQWYRDIETSSRTPSYRYIPRQRALLQAVYIYKKLKDLYFAEQTYQEIFEFLKEKRYIDLLYDEDIPIHEAVYALIFMRRHIWLFSEIHALYIDTAIEMHQLTLSINRVVLLFDYIIYIVIWLYHELDKEDS